ncbi:MAG: DUF192 domain-containing protein [Chloroflexota bacterium]
MRVVTLILGIAILAASAAGCTSPATGPNPPAATFTPGKPSPAAATAVSGTPVGTAVLPVPAVATPTAELAATPRAATPTTAASGPTGPTATSAATPAASPSGPGPAAPAARITTASGRQVAVRLEVADTPETRATGLSRRPSLPEDAGMLFVFPADGQAAFWMKDTLIPLSIAFISAEGRILEIQDMERLSEELHRPAQPYRYAMEVNQGFFKRNEINAGDRVEFQLGGR